MDKKRCYPQNANSTAKDYSVNVSICRAEVIVRYLAWRDPPDIVVFQLLRFALCDGGVEQGQMHRKIGICMNDVHKHMTDHCSI